MLFPKLIHKFLHLNIHMQIIWTVDPCNILTCWWVLSLVCLQSVLQSDKQYNPVEGNVCSYGDNDCYLSWSRWHLWLQVITAELEMTGIIYDDGDPLWWWCMMMVSVYGTGCVFIGDGKLVRVTVWWWVLYGDGEDWRWWRLRWS